ncbi:pilin [Patescibacteria group bacterium]|nr:pilin [Patescibacteria group bacterium]
MSKNLQLVAKTIVVSFVLILPMLYSQPVFAQERSAAGSDALNFLDTVAGRSGLATTKDAEGSLLETIGNIINVILGFVGIVFFIQLFWAGFRWMTSSGNEEVIKEAKGTIRTAVIGIVVVFSAFLITNFTLNQVQKVSNTAPTPPPATPAEKTP